MTLIEVLVTVVGCVLVFPLAKVLVEAGDKAGAAVDRFSMRRLYRKTRALWMCWAGDEHECDGYMSGGMCPRKRVK